MTTRHPDPEESLVLFADLQEGIATLPLTVPTEALGRAVSALAQLAALREVPVLVSTVPSEGGSPPKLIPALESSLGAHSRFVRTICNSALDPSILAAIKATGRKKVLISGVATEIAVALPALSLAESGFEVFVVVDATGGLSPRTEDGIHKTLASSGVSLTSVASVAGVFAKDFAEPVGQKAVGILYAMAGA